MWEQLRILDLEIALVAAEDIRLPFFRENALRTALSTSLRTTVCPTPSRETCRGCDLETLCGYPKLFPHPQSGSLALGNHELEGVPPTPDSRPLVPKPRNGGASPVYLSFFAPGTPTRLPAGTPFTLHLRLLGPAVAYLPYFYFCLENLARKGIGLRGEDGKRGRFVIDRIEARSPAGAKTLVFSRENGSVSGDWRPFTLADYLDRPRVRALRLATLSPLRLKYRNRLASSLELHIVLRAALRRITDLYFRATGKLPEIDYAALLARAAAVGPPEGDVRWVDYRRYSTTQQTEMKLGGLVGEVVYRGELTELYPFLKAGEVLAIGKSTAFGFGRYTVKAEEVSED